MNSHLFVSSIQKIYPMSGNCNALRCTYPFQFGSEKQGTKLHAAIKTSVCTGFSWSFLFLLYLVPKSAYDSLFLCDCCWALLHCFIDVPATNPWGAVTPPEFILRYVELGLFFTCVCDFAIVSTEFHLLFYHSVTYYHDISERWQWRPELFLLYNK